MIIRNLYRLLVPGIVLPPSWFIDEGVSYQLLDKYTNGGWLVRVSDKGGYTTVHDTPSIIGLCAGLEAVNPTVFHLSGVQALIDNGVLSGSSLTPLISSKKKNIPKWASCLSRYDILVKRMDKNCIYDFDFGIQVKPYPLSSFGYRCSSNERAIVELLSTCESCTKQYFDEVERIFFDVYPALNMQELKATIEKTSSQVALRLLKHFMQATKNEKDDSTLSVQCRSSKPMVIVSNGMLDRKSNLYI